MIDVTHFDPNWDTCSHPDYHAIVSVQICDLSNDGFFDLSRSDWDFQKYTTDQHARLCRKITEHFWFREIALIPPGRWKHEFLRTMNEIMPKYIYFYKALDSGMNLGSSSEFYKSRNIFSDFPQTNLAGDNQDYASTGNDVEYERIKYEDIIELAARLKDYNDVDRAIIDEIEPLFSCLFSLNVNGY